MAGPCSAETEEQVDADGGGGEARRRQGPARRRLQAAQLALQLPGARRGGPAHAARRAPTQHDLKLVSEVMDVSQIDADRAATPTSSRSARATCRTSRCCASSGTLRKPVLLKRGISATIEEWLLSAEYILAGGNTDVILCERGIRTFESYTRNTLDISAIPVVKKLSHLPIIVDPSHGTGRRDKVAPMARAAVAAGADGLHHRGALRSRPRAERRRAVAVPGAVRSADGRAAHHRARPSAAASASSRSRAAAGAASDAAIAVRDCQSAAVDGDRSLPMAAREPARAVFERIAIVGLGLIGGSIALAARAALAVGAGHRRRPQRRARAGDACGTPSTSRADDLVIAAEADLVVLAAPVAQNIALLPRPAERARGPTRSSPTSAARSARSSRRRARCRRGCTFVGGHPLAGAARGGHRARAPGPVRGPAVVLHAARPATRRRRSSALSAFVAALGAAAACRCRRPPRTTACWRSSATCRS